MIFPELHRKDEFTNLFFKSKEAKRARRMSKHEVIVENVEVPRSYGDQVCGQILITLPKPKDVTSVEVVFSGIVETNIHGDDVSYHFLEVLFE